MINIKRQSTIKTVIKVSKRGGVDVSMTRYSGASTSQSNEERAEYISNEGFVLPNGEKLFLKEIQETIQIALDSLIESKINGNEVNYSVRHNIIITE